VFDRPLYYNHEGEVISLDEWSALISLPEYKIVARDQVFVRDAHSQIDYEEGTARMRGVVSISTVWLGLDHSWWGGPPIIFETMIFGGAHDEAQWRYATHLEAIQGHADAVALVRREAHLINSPIEAENPAPEPPSDR